jgi:extracellular elastinolytic metalloproteinase
MSLPLMHRFAAGLLACAIAGVLPAAEAPLGLSAPRTGEPVEIARDFFTSSARSHGLGAGDAEHRISSVVPTRHNGMTHVYLQQTLDGIDVDGAITTINVKADGSVLSVANAFVGEARGRSNSSEPRLDAQTAYAMAASYLNVSLAQLPQPMGGRGGSSRHSVFPGGQLSAQPVPVQLIYVNEGNALRLAWNLIIDRYQEEGFYAEVRIDADTGQVIDIANYVAHAEPSKTGAAVGYSTTYRVLPMPFESPSHPGAALAVVSDPFDPEASPRGWHDTRALGSTGYEFASTRGNNVAARADLNSTNSSTNYLAPATVDGNTLRFEQIWDPNAQPTVGGNQPSQGNVPAAVVNLFYWNNILHDALWRYGFDEPAGNFQVNNYGRGGLGNDAVNADALDGADLPTPNTNNANFATPADGSAPRMQMYRWLGPMVVRVTSPISRDYEARKAGFGAEVTSPVNGSFAIVSDGTANANEGCNALTNGAQVAGRIALVRRGSCEFGMKALNAQNAGAIATVIYNNQGGDALISPGAGAVGNQVTIPVAFIGQNNGDELAATLQSAAASGGLLPPDLVGPDRDSDFDAGIIGHEYAHGLSNRLTGGPAAASCLNNAEQAGEGWSDFVGLMLTMPANACAAPRSVGTYPSFQPHTGPGIRRFPYSRNRAVNPFTFADTNDPLQSQPHGIGTVWATMLWDMTCDLIDVHGQDADLVRGAGGNNIAMRLVVDGLKQQSCRPSFTQARDGILSADASNNAGAHRCLIWKAFAARGLGFSADSGLNTDRSDQREAFDVPANCGNHLVTVVVNGTGSVFPSGNQSMVSGGRARIDITPGAGQRLQSIQGCGGTLNNARFDTAPVSSNCTVTVNFESIPVGLFANGFEATN